MSLKVIPESSPFIIRGPSKDRLNHIQQSYHPTKEKVALAAYIVLGSLAMIAAGVLIAGAIGASVGSFGIFPACALIATAVGSGVLSALALRVSLWAGRSKNDVTFKDFDAYVINHCRQIVPGKPSNRELTDKARELAAEGEHIIQNLDRMDAEQFPAEQKKDMLKKVVWYFTKRAFETGQGFEKGTIKFVDDGHKIVKFFESIMEGKKSSHFKKTRDLCLRTMGNMNFREGELPYIFTHVHMGTLKQAISDSPRSANDPTFSFLKLETVGLGGAYLSCDAIVHLKNYVMDSVIAKLVGEAEGPNGRKEKYIPKPIKKAFEVFCKEIGSKVPKMNTVGGMYRWAKKKQREITKNHWAACERFEEVLKALYPDHTLLPYRTGGEAMIDPRINLRRGKGPAISAASSAHVGHFGRKV